MAHPLARHPLRGAHRGGLPRVHRDPQGLEAQVRARQGDGAPQGRPRPLQRRPLPRELRLHPADVLRRRRPARRAGPRAGAVVPMCIMRARAIGRMQMVDEKGHRRQDHRGAPRRPGGARHEPHPRAAAAHAEGARALLSRLQDAREQARRRATTSTAPSRRPSVIRARARRLPQAARRLTHVLEAPRDAALVGAVAGRRTRRPCSISCGTLLQRSAHAEVHCSPGACTATTTGRGAARAAASAAAAWTARRGRRAIAVLGAEVGRRREGARGERGDHRRGVRFGRTPRCRRWGGSGRGTAR